jgi:adenylate kinase
MRLVLLGAPGSGKGTQSELLGRRYDIPQIATGDILRAAMAAGSPLGLKARDLVNAGTLVPDDLMVELIEDRLAKADAAQGFVLDGFPRSIPQAEGLERFLKRNGVTLDAVIKLAVPKRVLIERLTKRMICSGCGSVYNLESKRPVAVGKCDRCGGVLVLREDDTGETVRRRLNVYQASTAPLIDFYDSRGLLLIVHGEGTIPEVAAEIEQGIKSRPQRSGRED